VNLLRVFSGNVVVWGARTVSTDTLYRYISTRRLVNYIEESLQEGLRWAVFEPNTLTLRKQILRTVRDFLDRVWRDGGLFGETADKAYYARFPDIFNTDAERALGRLTLEVGLRVTFPAEFIVIRIGVITRDPTAT
jgi:phage tail sheath protein FI